MSRLQEKCGQVNKKTRNAFGRAGLCCVLAETVRFELTKGCPLPVFKTGAIDHSAKSPFFRWVAEN